MHLLFDTVWKLHIGEIPEKPVIDYRELLESGHYYNGIEKEINKRYNEAIAAIKQNALTVGNPHLIEKIIPLPIGTSYKKDHFYPLPNGWDNVEILEKNPPVAILTLPEEKKNTMENMKPHGFCVTPDSKCTMNYCDDNGCVDRKRRSFEEGEWTASGSVAAPKEEPKPKQVLDPMLIEKAELASLRQQLEQKTIALDSYYKLAAEVAPLKEALKELLPISEKGLNVAIQILGYLPNDTDRQYEVEEIKAIIERARKLLSK